MFIIHHHKLKKYEIGTLSVYVMYSEISGYVKVSLKTVWKKIVRQVL